MFISVQDLETEIRFDIDISDIALTIMELKATVALKFGYKMEHIELLYNGVMLADLKTLENYDIHPEQLLYVRNTRKCTICSCFIF